MLYTLLCLMFKVFFIVAIGYVLRRNNILTGQDQKSCTNLLMKVAVYFTVVMSSQQEFSIEAAQVILNVFVYALLFFAICIPGTVFLSRRLKLEEDKRRVFVSSNVFCNVTFVGYPILQELYGNIGLLCAVVFSMVYNVLFYTWGMAYLGERERVSVRSLFRNKIAIVSVLALAVYFLQIRIPEPFFSTFHVLGSLTMPLSMLIIGCNLAQSGIRNIIRGRELYLSTALRMVIVPGVVYLVMTALSAEPLLIRVSTIIAALPAGAMTTIVAEEYHRAPGYAANIMVQTMLAMALTLPLWVFLVGI